MSTLPKYVAGPNDPILPPQLSDFKDKTTDEVFEELNRMPFFMTKLDDTDGDGGSNVTLDALKALAYEGEPHEIAGNFKNQGNDLYKVKRFRDARELYNKAIDVKCDDDKINESLYANRAACELELKNYRRCINDCKMALSLNPKNIKCYFRMAKAFLAIEKFDDCKEAIQFGLKFDLENKSLLNLLEVVNKKEFELKEKEEKLLKLKQEREGKEIILENAMKLRNINVIHTQEPPELLNETKIYLEDPLDYESQLIFPAIVMYPTTDEFDFIAAVSELSKVQDLLELVLDRPQEWFEEEGHENFTEKKLVAYMETLSGGLVKVGKKLVFHDILKMEKPSIPMMDNAIKIYFVPKSESEAWLGKWDRKNAIDKRL
ncbi:hypothetical protein Kpol_513p2 [Vanderwaltozyma polyspora DSM 70294]|uniref:Cns1/TTC4 wheel domain-containing protein n=1 Tax=Vanderwaltozyma polyspora (strain ATCC 22028 / DSM 70294 / BCRC 21397 / CBS 2163 / NBRC 10782 / NRRL Y-8283 / UCD 57-17) TaxID=436907 RepID=A7TMI8_VANPO|nr:uncharacterized protein Kpol_513p2 [Vanderwaltozyma polyspora DSM 70294]EDO16486.1 hypothetical protein Kpol_513p2 [Vanderwaltozyma polyspora DSM 70294]